MPEEFRGRSDDFSKRHPEVGPIKEGSMLSINQANNLANLLWTKIEETDQNGAMFNELLLIDEIARSGSSCLQRWIDVYVPTRENFIPQDAGSRFAVIVLHNRLTEIINIDEVSTNYPIGSTRDLIDNPKALSDALNNLTDVYRTIRSNPQLFESFKLYSQALVVLISRIVEYNEGLKVDHYIEGKIKQITDTCVAAEIEKE
jgi:hypothetical protein